MDPKPMSDRLSCVEGGSEAVELTVGVGATVVAAVAEPPNRVSRLFRYSGSADALISIYPTREHFRPGINPVDLCICRDVIPNHTSASASPKADTGIQKEENPQGCTGSLVDILS